MLKKRKGENIHRIILVELSNVFLFSRAIQLTILELWQFQCYTGYWCSAYKVKLSRKKNIKYDIEDNIKTQFSMTSRLMIIVTTLSATSTQPLLTLMKLYLMLNDFSLPPHPPRNFSCHWQCLSILRLTIIHYYTRTKP